MTRAGILLHSTTIGSALAILETSVLDPRGATNQRYAVPRIPGVYFNYATDAIASAYANQGTSENVWGDVCFAFEAVPAVLDGALLCRCHKISRHVQHPTGLHAALCLRRTAWARSRISRRGRSRPLERTPRCSTGP